MAEILAISIAKTEIGCNVRDKFTHTPAEVAAGLQAHVEAQNKKRKALLHVDTICLAVTPAMAEVLSANGGTVYFNGRIPYIKVSTEKLAEICK